MTTTTVKAFLDREAQALRTRVDQLRPFSVTITTVNAANVSAAAMSAIESQLKQGRGRSRKLVDRFRQWLLSPVGRAAPAAEAQRRFTAVKLQFHSILSDFDIFADALVQRSEHTTGVWIAGLDDLAADAVRLPGMQVAVPPMICYLDRGHGAAIRRARTRLPGGGPSPVAVIRVPRERMIGLGIGASLVHEVGHQAAHLLDLLGPLRLKLKALQGHVQTDEKLAWMFFERWLPEIVADFWAVGKLGVGATWGLSGVVSLPRVFMFQITPDDPHPFPWIRVVLSIHMGQALYPHAQWGAVERMWEAMYPLRGLPGGSLKLIGILRRQMDSFVQVLLQHLPVRLGGVSLGAAMRQHQRTPARLQSVWDATKNHPERWHTLPPTLALAAITHGCAFGQVSPKIESSLISRLLTEWAVRSSLLAFARPAAGARRSTGFELLTRSA